MKSKFQPIKGTRDWHEEDAILRNEVRDTLRTIFEKYGYNAIETPMLESAEALGFKGGGEIQKEVFQLTDQGGRPLGLRFDQTVPLGRFMATHADVKLPFKRYVIGEVFRDGPSKPEQGRYRTFTQCDIDVLGIEDMTAEAEVFLLAQDAFSALGLGGVDVKINNRKLLEGILSYARVPQPARVKTIATLDKMDKLGPEGVREELNELIPDSIEEAELMGVETGTKLLTSDMIGKLLKTTQMEGSNEETYNRISKTLRSKAGKEGLQEIKQLLDYSTSLGLDFIQFDPCLARGLDYYTGTTIEVFLQDKSIVKSAITAGGRYDNMVGAFREEGEEIPAVGISFGLERLTMILKQQRETVPRTQTQLYLISIGDTLDATLNVAQQVRAQGVNTDLALQRKKKVGMSIGYADSVGIPYVGFVGEDEIREGVIKLKHLESGDQCEVPIKEIGQYFSQK